jgi:conjugative relaxase-like TrwC/TraI family protein
MMTMSKPLSAGQAQRYHQEQLRDVGENYYSEGQEILGEWHGQLAAAWGLEGPVDETQFARLTQGQHPLSGDQLIRIQPAHAQASERRHTADHRAAWDLTISAPKSVSVTALVGGDERVRTAHRHAVDVALRATEPYVQARIGGNHPPETTGQWVAATFEHDSARPVAGYSAPQLHTHTVVFNLTTMADGRLRALQPRELYRTQQYATAVYRSELATRLMALGYEIERGASGQPEIRGYTPDYLEASSPRRRQIETRLEQEGRRGAAAAQIAAHKTREAKSHASHNEMRERHRRLAQTFGEQPSGVVARAHERTTAHVRGVGPNPHAGPSTGTAGQQAVLYARDRNLERDAVPHERDYLRDALSRSMGRATVSEIQAEFEHLIRRGEFVEIAQTAGRPGRAYTTPAMIALEQRTMALMQDGQQTQAPLIHPSTQAAVARDYADLSADQRAAAAEIFRNRDRVQALEGIAGAGKTTTLAAVRDAAERDGYVVKGLAPTGRAAHQLADAGMPTTTLQRHLVEPPAAAEGRRRLYVLDEASLASTTQMHTFLTRLEPHDRVLLVGDARQHQAVDAGRPYEQLQETGMAVARLHDIKRQRDPALKAVVERLSEGEVRAAVNRLEAQGRVHAIADPDDRLRAVATAYATNPVGTLVVSPDNQSRGQLNTRIRAALQETGHVGREERPITVLVPRQDLTGADRRWAGHYATGDVVRYTRGSPEHALESGAYARVTAVDGAQNTLTVTRGDGRSVTYDPRRLQGVTVYREVERTFAVGDRVQFTAPFRTAKIANREMGTITAMTDRQDMCVRTDSGKTVKFSVDSTAHGPRAHRHLDHGYAVTSYSSQGLTADRVLLYIDSEQAGERLVNQRLAYVALSRGRHDAQIYTDDRDRLSTALSRDVSKSSAHAVRSAEQTPHGDRSPSRHAALRHVTTIDAGMTPTSVGRERTLADATPRSTAPRLSTEELQSAREYLARPETQQYLRAREALHTRTPQPRAAVAIEARHVASVFRELAGERGSRFVPTPPTTMPVPSTKRVIEAAVAVASSEVGAANRLGVSAPQGVAHESQQTPGHATGHGCA